PSLLLPQDLHRNLDVNRTAVFGDRDDQRGIDRRVGGRHGVHGEGEVGLLILRQGDDRAVAVHKPTDHHPVLPWPHPPLPPPRQPRAGVCPPPGACAHPPPPPGPPPRGRGGGGPPPRGPPAPPPPPKPNPGAAPPRRSQGTPGAKPPPRGNPIATWLLPPRF